MKIEELGLSARAYNVLKRARIDTVEQLQQLSDDDLLCLRNMGVGTVKEIREKEERRWIPVVERLPEKVATYLVLTKSGNYSVQWFCIFSEDVKGFFFAENPEKITHWMPLPEPPKEENHEN